MTQNEWVGGLWKRGRGGWGWSDPFPVLNFDHDLDSNLDLDTYTDLDSISDTNLGQTMS